MSTANTNTNPTRTNLTDTFRWYDIHDNLLKLAHHLVDEGDLGTMEDVLYFFEKPWKWTSEWVALIGPTPTPTAGSAEWIALTRP